MTATSSADSSCGGWVPATQGTGASSTVVRLVGWVAAASAAFSAIGTGGELLVEHLQRSNRQAQYKVPSVESAEVSVRSPAENLKRIREVLNPAVSDLATTLGVSRQSVYNWLNGDPVAEENAAKLEQLAHAADVLVAAGVPPSSALLKRKFFGGQTLLQAVQSDKSAEEVVRKLVEIYKSEAAQRQRISARFQNRARTPASADFDLPMSSEQA